MAFTILVVDDRREDRKLIGELLQQEPALSSRGLRLCEAADGVEALEVFRREQPNLVITDLALPRADGFQLCHGIRDLPEGRTVPLLVVSGAHMDIAVAKQLKDSFGADLLPKPIQPGRLLAKIAEALRRMSAPPVAAVDPLEITGPSLPPLEDADMAALEPLPFELPGAAEPAAPAQPAAPAAGVAPAAPPRALVLPSPLNFKSPLRTTLDKHPLAWVLVQLAASGATGNLRMARGKVRRVVYVVDGKPVYVDSNLRNETLGQYLVSKGVITEEQLAKALKQARQTSQKLGETLVRMGLTDEAVIRDGLVGQVRLKLVNALRWTDGAATWMPGDDFSSRIPQCPVDSVELVLLVLKKTSDPEQLRGRLRPALDQAIRLSALGLRFRTSIERAFGLTLLDQLLAGISLRRALAADDAASALVLAEALRSTALAELTEPAPDAPALDASDAGARSGVLDLRDIDPTVPRRKSGVIDLAELELVDPGEQPPPHAVTADSGVLSIPTVELELDTIEPEAAAPPLPPPVPAAQQLSPAEAARLRELLLGAYRGIHDKNFYEVLGLSRDAAPPEVEIAYRDALGRFSPERFEGIGGDAEKVVELAAIAEHAYTILSDPLRRRSYDETLALSQVQPEPTPDAFGAELLFQQGQSLLRERDLDQAVVAFRAAVEAHPGQPDYHAFLGWAMFLARGRGEAGALAAAPHLEEALRIAPDSAQAHELAGHIALDVHDHEAAAPHFAEALKAGAPRLDLFGNVKDLLSRLGRFEELEQQYRQLIFRLRDSDPLATVPLWVELSSLYAHRLGRPDNARVALQVAAKLAPADPRVQQAIGALEAASAGGWPQHAESLLRDFLGAPDDLTPLHELARLHLAGGRTELARAALAFIVWRGGAAPDEERLLARLIGPWLPRTPEEAELAALRPHDASPIVLAAIEALAPALAALAPVTLESLGTGDVDQLADIALPQPFGDVLSQLCALLRLERPPVYLSHTLGQEARPLVRQSPALVIGQPLADCQDPASAAAALTIALTCLEPARCLLVTRTIDVLKDLVMAGLSLFNPAIRTAPESRAAEWRAALDQNWRERLSGPMHDLMQERRVNLSEARRAVKRRSARLALLVGADLLTVLKSVGEERELALELCEAALRRRP